MEQIKIRPLQSTDRSYIFSTWLKCYKNYSYFAKKIRNKVFFAWHQKVLENLLNKSTTLVAYPEGDSSTILGYLSYERQEDIPVIHFVFVKKEFQRMGIARSLIKQAEIDLDKSFFTHWTYDLDDLISRLPGLTYDPYRI